VILSALFGEEDGWGFARDICGVGPEGKGGGSGRRVANILV
jgi:hypothetical protein